MRKYFLLLLLLALVACNTITVSINVEVVGISNTRGDESILLFKVLDSTNQNIIDYVIEEKIESEKVEMYKSMIGKRFAIKNYDKNKTIIKQINF